MPFKIPAESERNFEIKYRPLITGTQETKLVLENESLGRLEYDLVLKGIPSTTEKIMKFQIPLGSS